MVKNHREEEFFLKKECLSLVEIADQVHNNLGYGKHDSDYKIAFEAKLKYNGFDYKAQKGYLFNFNGIILQHKFYADFVINENVIVEIKSVPYQLNDYDLKVFEQLVTDRPKVGLIINFHHEVIHFLKIVLLN
ncbi:GxxExxY protein [Pedobacter jamesrossensis]|uniref:GxxExxY protein n=1 Tax=Pedobacter jamesrossensis TaxID=1908238 RepID=A0ABV8NMJ2_9SPHI